MNNSAYCLVLSGGGAKGIYHIGVWRALRELGIEVDAFIGNSIGAVIAGFLAGGKTAALEEIGSRISLDYIVDIPQEFVRNGELHLNLARPSGYRKFYTAFAAKRGVDTGPMRRLLLDHIDEEKLRASGNDLGVVTFNLSDLKPEKKFIDEMDRGELINYLLASSAFPGFERPEIAGKKYIDGGVYDNIPFSMARQRGYRRIIVVDISGIGIKRRFSFEGCEVIYIKNSINMGGVLDFNREFLDRYLELGYLDTLRTFGRLHGNSCFIVPEPKTEALFRRIVEAELANVLIGMVNEYLDRSDLTLQQAVHAVLPEHSRFCRNWLPVIADCAATVLRLERVRKWEYPELFEAVMEQAVSVRRTVDVLKSRDLREIQTQIKNDFRENRFLQSPYAHYLMVDRFFRGRMKNLLKRTLFELFPSLPAAVFFIEHAASLAARKAPPAEGIDSSSLSVI